MNPIIPYGKQFISDSDIEAVVKVLKSDFLTQGPENTEFASKLASKCEAAFATVVSNATAALYIAYKALGVGPGDILWTSPNTFVATSNAALLLGAKVKFIDIDINTFNMSIDRLEEELKQAEIYGALPKVIVPVHFAGQSCDMKALWHLSEQYGFRIVEDASHALGGKYNSKPVGNCEYSDICVFSFHPVKIITTGEGGALLTNSAELKNRIDMLTTHGITRDFSLFERNDAEPWFYEQQFLSLNFRLTDIQSSLGNSQLKTLEKNIARRREIAANYKSAFKKLNIKTQSNENISSDESTYSSWHLYVILLSSSQERLALYKFLRENNIYTNVHYPPVFTQPYYKQLQFDQSICPISQDYHSRCLSIPMFYGLSEDEQHKVIDAINKFFIL